jgi:pimeloyl-ACP methyl ester carboxylesterase
MGAPVLVCLHGLGRSPADWDRVRHQLGHFGQVTTPALPRNVQRARRIAGAATPDGAIVLGHSLGAIIALLMAAERGAAIRGVVASSPFFPPALNGRSMPVAIGNYAGHRVAFLQGLSAAHDRANSGSGGVRGLGFLIRTAAHRAEFRETMNAITSGVLVVHAVDDHYVPVDFVIAAMDARPAWQLRVLGAGGHYPHVSEPAKWLAAIGPWLERLSSSRDGG